MIMINLDVMMAKRKKGLTELAGEVDNIILRSHAI